MSKSQVSLDEKIRHCSRSMLNAWARGEHDVRTPPWLVYVNPTNICNNRCQMCPHDELMRKERGHMSLELFKRIIGELPQGVLKLYLLKQGEPFLNPALPEMIAHAKQARPEIHVAVHTNTTVPFNPGQIMDILRNLDSLGMSVSAIDADVYKEVHGTSGFERVLRNMNLVRTTLRAMPEEQRPYVFIDYVRQKANASERPEDVIDFYESNFPEFSSLDMHSMFNWQGAIEEANLTIYDVVPQEEFPCCVFPWSTITFCHDGKVSYCHEEARENKFLGDINEQSFEEIWNGEAYLNFRLQMVRRRYEDMDAEGFYCRKCSYLWDLHSRSPQNLTSGYSTNLQKGRPPIRYGNILEMGAEELVSKAADYYLAGDMHKSLGLLEHLEHVGVPEQVRESVGVLRDLNLQVVGTFKGMYELDRRLCELGEKKRPTIYHRLGRKA